MNAVDATGGCDEPTFCGCQTEAAKRKAEKRTCRNFRFQSRLAQRKCVQNSRQGESTGGGKLKLRLLLCIGGGKGVN